MIYFLFKITHLPTGRVVWLESATGCWYRMEDGSLLKVHSAPVWCGVCRGFRNGESVESFEKLEKEAAELSDPDWQSPLEHVFPDSTSDVHEEMARSWERRLKWRRRRVSPAKCLECGSVEIVQLPWNEAVPHPGGKGEILVKLESMGGTSPRGQTLYTPEGDLIGWEDDL